MSQLGPREKQKSEEKTKQNKTKQNKTKQNKTKQNKTKQNNQNGFYDINIEGKGQCKHVSNLHNRHQLGSHRIMLSVGAEKALPYPGARGLHDAPCSPG